MKSRKLHQFMEEPHIYNNTIWGYLIILSLEAIKIIYSKILLLLTYCTTMK